MKYTVVWQPSAEAELASIWMAAADRAAVSNAANDVDSRLRVNPISAGESRYGSERILIAPPLAVVFKVLEEDRIVTVLGVRHLANRGQAR